MTDELWRGYVQIGKETTAGTTVAATRRMYFKDPTFNNEREPRPHKFATASRDNVRAFTVGPDVVSGKLKMPLDSREIIELLLMGIKGGVTAVSGTSPTETWTFVPGTSLDPATIEWYDGARGWDIGGCYVNKLKISGSANGPNMVEADIFGMNITQATLTGSLAEGVPTFLEGWESKCWIDTFGGTPGTTQISTFLVNWELEISNGLMRQYFADNTNSAGALTISEIEVAAKLTVRATAAQALTEFNNFEAATKRLVRLDFGNNEVLQGADNTFVRIDLPGAWSAVDLGQTNENSRAYELSLQYVYDVTNAFGLQIIAQNDRATAWGDR